MTDSAASKGYHPAEDEHRADTGSGVLRASVFGMSDGLVSNLALVMGVAGGTGNADVIVVAGTAGLLAGAFSMAAGEYISMATQRESMQRQIDLERDHIERYPEEEQRHLTELLVENGLPPDTAAEVAHRIHEQVEPAADFHALLELGIVPGQMGSPLAASAASFVAFTLGAAVPLVPWLVLADALVWSLLVSVVALLLVGGAVTTVTSRNAWMGALRQVAFGVGAAGITWLIGGLVGASL